MAGGLRHRRRGCPSGGPAGWRHVRGIGGRCVGTVRDRRALGGGAPGRHGDRAQRALRPPAGSDTTVRGVPLSLGRADPLADALAVGRAIQPFRRPWLRGGRSELDVEATVEHYARGGPLVPLFRPAPEPWFEVVVLVDASLSMSVWEETTRAVTRLLTALGGFRAVHIWRLEWQGAEPLVRDHRGREVPADRVPHHGSGALGRRLIMVFSDCAARGWHTPEPWLLLRGWAHRVPVALVDPLPPRLWRRSALNLPAVQVTGSRVGAHNGTLRFTLPRRMEAAGVPGGGAPAGPWTALPVVSCTPHLLGAWAATLMRSDPAGCGAVLIPATGRLLPRTREGGTPPRRPDPGRLAEAFAHTAPAPAVRLAVLCSGLPDLPLPLLHVLHNEVVPEASPSDLAEVLTSGLFTVRRDTGSDPVLVFHPAARQYLRTHLTTHDEWRTRAAFGRHAAAHPNAPHGIAAVLHSAWAETELPAQEQPFAEAEVTVAQPAVREAPDTSRPTGDRPLGVAPGGAAYVAGRAADRLRSLLGAAVHSRALEAAERLLRLLIDYVDFRLPDPAGTWPDVQTVFDERRTVKGRVTADDLAEDLSKFAASHGVTLHFPTGNRVAGVPDLVWPAADGPVGIQVRVPDVFSWSARATDASSTLGSVEARACPVQFLVSLDESDRLDGFLDLDRCLRVAEWPGDRPGVTVHLRVQTRYGRAPSHSRASLAEELRKLHRRAGSPTFSELVREADAQLPPVALRKTTLHSWLTGRSVPAKAGAFDWLARHLLARAGLEYSASAPTADELAVLRHHAFGEELRQGERPSPERLSRLGRPVRAFDRATEELEMSRFVERSHDQVLREAVRECAAGTSRMVSLIGPVGSGKTRSGMEAMRELPSDWWLWEPSGSADLAAVLDGASEIPPRTVIWLDPGERYLLDRSESLLGQHIAAGLRRRLREIESGPVLVLASLRPEDWSLLTAGPGPNETDPYALPRALCEEGLVVHSWTPDDTAGTNLIMAGPPAALAIVAAAVDARRCGYGPAIPAQLLVDAARGYLDDQASQPSPADISPTVLAGMGLQVWHAPDSVGGPGAAPTHYQLSYLTELLAARSFRHSAPPDSLWDALAAHASGSELEEIARTAEGLGHTRQAERFHALAASDSARHGSLARQQKQARTLRLRLRRIDRTGADVRDTADEALDWLRANGLTESAQHVLNGLLSSTGLTRSRTAKAAGQALDWLTVHGEAPHAGFVLGPLLRIIELPKRQARQAIDHAVEWLGRHGDIESAEFVLRPALLRDDLSQAQAAAVADVALIWLELYSGRIPNTFVLSAALQRDDLVAAARTWLVACGIDWLRMTVDHTQATFVLRPLLQRVDLTPEEAHSTTVLALDWLRAHGTERDAQFVLSSLLDRHSLGSEDAREAGRLAHRWLHAQGSHASARHVLQPLLERDDLGRELLAESVAAGQEWMRTRPPGEQPDTGLAELLGKRRTEGAMVEERIVLVANIVGDADMSPTEQVDRASLLPGILSRVLERPEGLRWDSVLSGDSVTVVLIPDGVRRTPLVPDLLSGLEAELHDHAVPGRLRLHVALHYGAVGRDEHGWRGKSIMVAHRLVDSQVLHTALHEAGRSPWAAVVSDKLFGSAHFGSAHPLADRFRRVYVPIREGTEKAWIFVAGYEKPPGITFRAAPQPSAEAWDAPPRRPR
ncbi:SAV_2336 N-terminal domain-related protein [Streptomyces cyaneofuscatus]